MEAIPRSTYKNFYLDSEGFLQGLKDNKAPFLNRQGCPEVFKANGFIYIFPVKDFLLEENFPLKQAIPYFVKKEKCIDIDTPEDLQHVRRILQNS